VPEQGPDGPDRASQGPPGSDRPDRPEAGGPPSPHPHPHRDRMHERVERLEAAAIAAEMETGRHEETLEEAKRSLFWRTLRITAGILVSAFGCLLLVLPGPGLVVLAAGLVILAQDVPFAARMLEKVRRRLPTDADGKLPKGTIVMGLVITVLTVSASIWWTFLR
jgi:hypothetical protein